MAGLYIHIPFCESRCIYCGFYSTTSLKLRDAYVDALIKEMSLRPIHQELEEGEKIETVYLGGGTPSQLTGEQLIKLFDGINKYLGHFTRNMEITMECNPDDITEEFCQTSNSSRSTASAWVPKLSAMSVCAFYTVATTLKKSE